MRRHWRNECATLTRMAGLPYKMQWRELDFTREPT
jgi:hypothetical protein